MPQLHNESPAPFEQEINIQELLQVLWAKKRLITVVLVAVMSAVLIFHFSSTPEYRYPAMVLIKKTQNKAMSGIDPFGSLVSDGLGNDIELIKSQPLAEDVVRKLYEEPGRQKLELFGEKVFKSQIADLFSWWPGRTKPESLDHLPIDLRMRVFSARFQARVQVTNTRETDILSVSVSSPFPEEAAFLTNTLCRAYMRKDIEWNADQAIQVKDFVSEQLDKQKSEVAEIDGRLSSYMKKENIYELTGNAQNLLNQLIAAETRYNDAKSEYNILKKRQDFIIRKLSQEEKAFMAKVAENINRQSGDLKAMIRKQEKDLIGQEGGADEASGRQQLTMLKQRLLEVTRNSLAGELAYSTKARQFQFDLISEQLQIDVRLAELGYIADEYQRVKASYNSQLNQLPQKQLNFARLQRDRDVLNNTYTFLKGKLEESRIQIASEVGKVVIVGESYPLGGPIAPNLKKNLLIGLILGLGLGGALVFVKEMMDHSLKDDQFLENHGYLPLAAIPYVDSPGDEFNLQNTLSRTLQQISSVISGLSLNGNGKVGGNLKHKKQHRNRSAYGLYKKYSTGKPIAFSPGQKPLLIADQLAYPLAESFRELRTNITFAQVDRTVKSILITGTEVGEGKSTVCINLAFAFALIGKRVLVIDCDLRRPSQHRMLNTRISPGLSDHLAGTHADVRAIIQTTTMHENLSVLAAGSKPPNPNELIGSQKMTELVKALEQEWDYVFLDSPPLLLLSDTALLTKSTDAILMVVRIGYTNKNVLKDIQKLNYVKENLLGVAIIGPDEPSNYGNYGRYYGRYGSKGYYSYQTNNKYLTPDIAKEEKDV